MVLRQLLEIFPNTENLGLYGYFGYFKDVWPSSHFTKLNSFYDFHGLANTLMIPQSTNAYHSLYCSPELMLRGIDDGKFQPQRVLKLTLDMENSKIDCKEVGELLATMSNLNFL